MSLPHLVIRQKKLRILKGIFKNAKFAHSHRSNTNKSHIESQSCLVFYKVQNPTNESYYANVSDTDIYVRIHRTYK